MDKKIPETVSLPLYSKDGEVLETIEFPVSRLGGRIHRDVLRQAVITYEANQRAGTVCTKTRGDVSYSGVKPWPQKGTGRARAGSRSSPVWVGGGVVHGPKPRDYSKKLNKKMRRKALCSALIGKLVDGEVKLIEGLELDPPKTAGVAKVLKAMGVQRRFMIVTPGHDPLLWRCTRNIPGAAVMPARDVNAYAALRARDLIFLKEAFEMLVDDLAPVAGPGAETVEAG